MDWSNEWELAFNRSKCSVLHLGCRNVRNNYTFDSNDGMMKLMVTDTEKDLGILIDSQLDFGVHINHIVNKANNLLGLIKRSFVIRDRQSLLLLYKSTVRPVLEYGSAIWSPWKRKYIDSIEQIQRRFTKLIQGTKGLTYEQRLLDLNLHTLAFRRKREQLIQVYKLMHNLYDAEYGTFFQRADYDATRGNVFKLKTVRSRLLLRSRFFTVDIIHSWNRLPSDIVNSATLNSFKSAVGHHLRDEWYRY